MKVKSLRLKNFRNYGEEEFVFDEGINILYGENAQGKTNVVEALYMFSSSRSHRGVRDRELVRFGEKEAEAELSFYSQNRDQSALMKLFTDKNKKLSINGIEQRYVKALLGVFGSVIFSPEDLNLIKEGPEERRKFLDTDISLIRPNYYRFIKEFRKVNELKNNLLKNPPVNGELLDVYNEKISALAAKITVHRHRFVEELSALTSAALMYISGNSEQVEIKYKPGFDFSYSLSNKEIYESYKKEFEKVKEEELKKGVSLIGPHRDDISFIINGRDAKIYASQGQQRSVITALKLAEYEFMKGVLGEPPILLLDDIFSELDKKRQEKLLGFLKKGQVIITCTDRDLIGKIKYPCRLFQIKDGKII